MTRQVTERDFRMPEFMDAKPEDYEFRDDGVLVRKDRWECAVREIAQIVGRDGCDGFEIPDVIDDVRTVFERAEGSMKECERFIVCAANRNGTCVVLGARHHDERMNYVIDMLDRTVDEPIDWEQGFIDQRGNFLTRQEAWHIALENGQIRRRVGGDDADGGTLYSENLY